MAANRLETLKSMIAQSPNDNRTRYMLAMELRNLGDLEGAVQEFETLIAADAGFGYAYFHCGQTLEQLGRPEEARKMYARGIEAASDDHARAELQAAMEALP